MSFARVVLALSALPFVAIGLGFLLSPAAMAACVEVSLASTTADHDVRAVYGGLQLGCGAYLAWGAARPDRARAALVAQLLLYGALSGARAIAWLVAGPPNAFGLLLHALELTGFVAGWVALRRLDGEARA